jgi:hypothetical protein
VLVAWYEKTGNAARSSSTTGALPTDKKPNLSTLKQVWKTLTPVHQLPEMTAMAQAERPIEATLPWDMLTLGVPKSILAEEARISLGR